MRWWLVLSVLAGCSSPFTDAVVGMGGSPDVERVIAQDSGTAGADARIPAFRDAGAPESQAPTEAAGEAGVGAEAEAEAGAETIPPTYEAAQDVTFADSPVDSGTKVDSGQKVYPKLGDAGAWQDYCDSPTDGFPKTIGEFVCVNQAGRGLMVCPQTMLPIDTSKPGQPSNGCYAQEFGPESGCPGSFYACPHSI